ncbi:het domain protein [Moniliophthora roreri MCA 2997]|nr:het domain protein [Moniliophthora roreri MCA 2997]KAI3618077.1 het domain protein [Moniliophthora roreri]
MSRIIYNVSFDQLADSFIDFSTVAKPCHYRLIDCSHFAQRQSLCIYEFTGSITAITYAAISYVWRGNPLDTDTTDSDLGAFSVKGAEDGDPVGINVLLHVCTAALMEEAPYLWLDRLCIMQTSKDDKAWQITRMYGVYLNCKICLVLPGGIRRLVTEEEETTWIERGWTLQEITAPKRSMVLFRWEYGSGRWEGYNGGVKGTIREVKRKESAMVPLREILEACTYPEALGWKSADGFEERDDISPTILGDLPDGTLTGSLIRGMDAEDPEAKAHAMWQNSFWRTSSRPVDMVLSIMRIFGVTLDPRLFHKDDRVGATIALAKEILQRGGKPTWLVMAYDIPPSRFLSSFPEFPSTNVAGEISFPTASNEQQWELTLWWVKDLPSGSMDDDGYVTITSKAAPVVDTKKAVERRTFSSTQNDDLGTKKTYVRVVARDGRVWKVLRRNDFENHSAFIIFLGHAQDYPRAEASYSNAGPFVLPRLSPLRAIIVEEHANRKYHRSAAVTLGEVFEPVIQGEWQEHTFAIGGPDPLPPGTFRGDAVIHIEED